MHPGYLPDSVIIVRLNFDLSYKSEVRMYDQRLKTYRCWLGIFSSGFGLYR
jgi:hypothetical protein